MQNGTAALEDRAVWQFLSKLKILLPCDLVILLLGNYSNESNM
jgi:hypothetical protein